MEREDQKREMFPEMMPAGVESRIPAAHGGPPRVRNAFPLAAEVNPIPPNSLRHPQYERVSALGQREDTFPQDKLKYLLFPEY